MKNYVKFILQNFFQNVLAFIDLFYGYQSLYPFFHLLRLDVTCVQYVQKQPRRCSLKEDVLKNFANFTGKHPCWSCFLIKLQVEISSFFTNTYFEEHLRATADQMIYNENYYKI